MKKQLNIDDKLLQTAAEATGIADPQELILEGLKALIAREAARRLIALGGSMPGAKAAPRRRAVRRKAS